MGHLVVLAKTRATLTAFVLHFLFLQRASYFLLAILLLVDGSQGSCGPFVFEKNSVGLCVLGIVSFVFYQY